ncbi:hypothetical protein [Peptoniphilus sp.]|uniref:hypothetical protein n=1 Tax=Peptoniphilus sp. TaxID=1971214 RepID=UPI00399496B7
MKYIIDPYNMEYEYNFKNSTFLNGVEVATIEDVFNGTKNVRPDSFTIDGKILKPLWYDSKAYYETKSKSSVRVSIDADKRMDLAEEVTANALLRLVIKNTFALNAKYQIFDRNIVVLDKKDITYQDFDQMEILCNQIVRSNLPIEVDGNVADIKGLGSISIEGPILKRTSEVSIIKLMMPKKSKSGIEIEILGGRKAYLDYKNKSKLIENMMMTFRVDEENLFAKLKSIAIGKGYDFERELDEKESEKSQKNKDERDSKKSETSSKDDSDKKPNFDTQNFLDSDDFPEKPQEDLKEYEEDEVKYTSEDKTQNAVEEETKDAVTTSNSKTEDEDHLKNESPLPKGLNEVLSFVKVVDDIKYIYKIQNKYSQDELKEITKYLTNLPSYVVVLGTLQKDYSDILVSRSKNLNVDLKEILDHVSNPLKRPSGNMFQVEAMCRPSELSNVMEEFLMEIKSRLGV